MSQQAIPTLGEPAPSAEGRDSETEGYDPDRDGLNPRWAWSEAVVDWVLQYTKSPSVKICTGTSPIADENVDINEYDGVTTVADMFDLPDEWTDRFATVISDPPWRGKSESDRRQMFDEALRVCEPGGLIIYNATWIPENERTTLRKKRFRQQEDFWGNASFVTVFQHIPSGAELLELFECDEDLFVDEGFFATVDYKEVDPEFLTDPRIVNPGETDYCCPKCGNSNLSQNRDESLAEPTYDWDIYECMNHRCGFRALTQEIYEQRDRLRAGDYPDWHPEGDGIPEVRPANCSVEEFKKLKEARTGDCLDTPSIEPVR